MRKRLYIVLFLMLWGFTANAYSVTEEEGFYLIEHSWRSEKDTCFISLRINKELYEYYQKDREHLIYKFQFGENELPPTYFGFMFSEYDRPVVREIASQLGEMASSKLEQVKLAVSFVQSIPYAYDSISRGVEEYVRYPVETLVEGCGDCEDKVMLLSAILFEMNADFILLMLPDHMALGLHCDDMEADRYLLLRDKKYYYIETTHSGWQLGQMPKEYYSAEIEAVPINVTPSLRIKGVRFESQPASVHEKALCEFKIDLHNLGPGKVTNLQVHVRLIDQKKKSKILSEEYFALDDLSEGELRTETLSFKSLIRENSVLRVEISGAEVSPQFYETALTYSKTRRF